MRIAITLLALPLIACDPGASDTTDTGAIDPGSETAASAELATDLQFLREEEKLARDVYLTLYDAWGSQVFTNISGSEQRHTDSVAARLAALGIDDPVVDDTRGVFVDEVLAGLYDQLSAAGAQSLSDALTVGATIEDLDLKDLAEMAARTEDGTTLALYDALACGSRNHMRAFYGQLEGQGGSYEAQYISAEDLAAIVGTAHETCTEP